EQRMAVLERARQGLDLDRAEQRARAADVVAVAVAEDEQVEATLAAAAQQRHEDALAGVAFARVLRAAVEEQRVFARADEHGRALADVGGDDVEAALGRERRGRHEQGERERHGDELGATAAAGRRAPRRPAPRAAPTT